MKYEPVAQLKKTCGDLLKSWRFCLLVILFDLVFLTVFGFVYSLYFEKIMLHMTNIMQAMPSATEAIQSAMPTVSSLAPVFGVNASLSAIYRLAFFLAVSVFLLWIIIQSSNWRFAHRIAESKTKFLEYFRGFSIASIIWFLIFCAIVYYSVTMTFYQALNREAESSFSVYGALLAFAVLGYFALVSYSVTGKTRDVLRKTVTNCFLKSKVLVAYIFVLLILAVINFIILGLWYLSQAVAIAIGAILVLLYFVYARVYMIEVIKTTKFH